MTSYMTPIVSSAALLPNPLKFPPPCINFKIHTPYDYRIDSLHYKSHSCLVKPESVARWIAMALRTPDWQWKTTKSSSSGFSRPYNARNCVGDISRAWCNWDTKDTKNNERLTHGTLFFFFNSSLKKEGSWKCIGLNWFLSFWGRTAIFDVCSMCSLVEWHACNYVRSEAELLCDLGSCDALDFAQSVKHEFIGRSRLIHAVQRFKVVLRHWQRFL